MTQISKAQIVDCAACAKLSQIEELRTPFGDFISESFYQKMIEEDAIFYVTKKENEIIGFLVAQKLKGDLVNLDLLTVKKEYRNKGVGKKLLDTFQNECKKLNAKFILLYAPKMNQKTQKFYEACGFTPGKDHVPFMKKL